MILTQAKKIREIKKSCTYRALAEKWTNGKSIHQYDGIVLCRDALKVLYPDYDVWMMFMPEERFGKSFKMENKSYCSDFYWGE